MKESELVNCANCVRLEWLDIDFTVAFQPIVHAQSKRIFGYEALARGLNNEPAYSVLSQVNDKNRYAFD